MSMIGAIGSGYGAYAGLGISNRAPAQEAKPILNPNESTTTAPGKKSSPAECETCKNCDRFDNVFHDILINGLVNRCKYIHLSQQNLIPVVKNICQNIKKATREGRFL